jgi:inner membrane protein
MDPLTQGIVGTTAAQAYSKKKNLVIAGIIGFLAGLAPDIDIFFRSDTDPLLFLEYHRQFTHSLIFIPIGVLSVQ